MVNKALQLNGPTASTGHADIAITTHGSDWYFTVAAVMAFSTLVFWGLAFRKPRTQRLFYYITAGITMVSAIAYFTEGSNLGWVAIPVEWIRSDSKVRGFARQIFWVRYIDYFVTLPLILLNLLLTAALPWPTILYTILINWIMVVSLLVGTLVHSTYKWGYFTFGTVSYLFLAYTMLWSARQHAADLGGSIYRTYLKGACLVFFLWLLYPVAWGCSEGGNIIAPDSEAVFYGIIDILSKPVFGALLLWGHQDIELAHIGLDIRDVVNDTTNPRSDHHFGFSSARKVRLGSLGSLLRRKEKAAEAGAAAPSNGATNGAAENTAV